MIRHSFHLCAQLPKTCYTILKATTMFIFKANDKQSCNTNNQRDVGVGQQVGGEGSAGLCHCLNKIKYEWTKLKIGAIDEQNRYEMQYSSAEQ
jgi:hypothetical protein